MGDFVQLHNHTAMGSLLDSMVRVDELVEKAKELNMPSVAISDHGSLSSFVRLYKKCKENDIKPIFGVEMYMVDNMNIKDKDEKKQHILLLAKNNKGLKNLFKIVTIGNKHFYKKPQIDFELLKKYKEGLIVASACLAGKISQLALSEQYQEMEQEIKKYKNEFGDDYYLEIMANKMPDQIKVNKVLATASKRLGVPLIATNDIHYLNKEDFESHDILLAVQTHANINDEERFQFPANEFYFKNYGEMKDGLFDGGSAELNKVAEEALKNTLEVSNKIEEFELDLGNTNFPNYDKIPQGYDADSFLTAVSNKRLKEFAEKGNIDYEKYKERLEHELDVITTKGFSTYFLVTAGIIGWAKSNGILIGAGRGSAGSSLVSYLLGIIEIDPIEYNLVFSRFLNKEREALPDIDIDVPNAYREEVIQYIRDEYGAENVAQICTFGTMSTKAVLKDVGRALGLSFGLLNDEIVPLIDDDADDIEDALERSVELQRYKDDYPKLFRNAIKLEGIPRHLSKHAGAVVISPKRIDEITAMSQTKGDMITQTEMHDSEELGMLKMDFLGLKTLDLVQNTIDFIHKRDDLDSYDWIPTVNNLYREIDLEDENVYRNIYQKADTSGVFQVESDLYHQLLKAMKPKEFEHIISLLAIGRPSILQADLDQTFMDRLHGIEKPEYPHEDLEDVLESTFGIMLFQEQVLEVARTIAGFSYGRADILRRTIGKKKPEELKKMKDEFVEGALSEGYSEDFAHELFELIEYFAGYGFNRSHSTGYAILSYITAWLKNYFPTEFYASLLTLESDKTPKESKMNKYISECYQKEITIKTSHINRSAEHFNVVDGNIVFGIKSIKGVGQSALEDIMEKQPFDDFLDFFERVNARVVNKTVVEALIKTGAFDEFNSDRKELLHYYYELRDNDLVKQYLIPQYKKATKKDIMKFERGLLSFSVTHPSKWEQANVGDNILYEGHIVNMNIHTTKNNNKMVFFDLEFDEGIIDVVAFPRRYYKYKDVYKEKNKVKVLGEKSDSNSLELIGIEEIA
jgi:DNA polymerase-3 subunit alpha